MATGTVISAAAEGIVDEAVARTVIAHAGATVGDIYGKQGKAYLRQKITGYNNAAQRSPWLVLVDLNREEECAPPLVSAWLPQPAARLCLRVAVRKIEAWLMADSERLARFLGVSRTKIPTNPEELEDPKTAMVNLARVSRRAAIRQDMSPRAGSGRPVGPAYSSRLIEFASSSWRPKVAAARSPSLRRAIDCLKRLAEAQ
ncbi:MAG: hypothetical protein HYY76_04260 [Acidobacteria bacterium]|nr:hypothetical protein [Acidobacteriota bacterium]